MKSPYLHLLKTFLPFAILLFIAQFFIVRSLELEDKLFYSTISIYLFHTIITGLTCVSLVAIHKVAPDKTGLGYLAMGVIKMLASIVFLIPLIKAGKENYIPDVFEFFIPFFLFLLYEMIFAVGILNSSKNKAD
ncbi:DUF6168 family protein [Aureivirga sp. CE67]|uniref:DUF6168 family protein n=1 Tax=Aureivirga sp. CE67 TaxID=1788983 RepID=UPI0018CA6335|nr:DUF6168 family protein [Aureivirga sp. CE67]